MVYNLPNSSSRPSLEMTLNIDPNKTPPITPMYTPLETPMPSPIKQTHHISQDHCPQTSDHDFISNSTYGMASDDMANSSFSTCPETVSSRFGSSPSSRKSSGTQTSDSSLPKGSESNPDPDAVTDLDDAVPRAAIRQIVGFYQGSLSENDSSREIHGRDFEAKQIDDGSGMIGFSTSTRDNSARKRANMLLGSFLKRKADYFTRAIIASRRRWFLRFSDRIGPF